MDLESDYLAKVLSDLGAESCDRNMFLDILQQLGPMLVKGGIELQLVKTLCMMCRTAHDSPRWNTKTFGQAVLETFPKLDINVLIGELDTPFLVIDDSKGAELFFNGLRALCKDFYGKVHLNQFINAGQPWKNCRCQLQLLFHSLQLAPDVLNWSKFSTVRTVIAYSDSSAPLSPSSKSIAASLSSQTWNCFDLFEFTAHLIDSNHFEAAKPIFELASRQCPELLCIALASIDPNWNSINKEILVKLTCGFLLGQPSSSVILPRLWSLNPNVLLFCMVEMHRREPNCLGRLLDVAQELKILTVIVDAKPFTFSLDLASLAARRSLINVEKWIQESISSHGEPFIRSSIEFLNQKVSIHRRNCSGGELPGGGGSGGLNVPLDILVSIVKSLNSSSPKIPDDLVPEFRSSYSFLLPDSLLLSTSPSMGITTTTTSTTSKSPSSPNSPKSSSPSLPSSPVAVPGAPFPSDVEEEVNAFFDRIFTREVSVSEVINILQNLKDSSVERDCLVYTCFLHNIFDEYRFFPKYPDNELHLTSILFGQLVACDLVTAMPLAAALRYVLDAIKKPPNQKLFKFGLQALLQFYQRLPEWPEFCLALEQISSLSSIHPDLYAFICNAVKGSNVAAIEDKPLKTTTSSPSATSTSSDISSGNPLVEFAESQSLLSPSDSVKDRTLFILNNLSIANMKVKANDLIRLLGEEFYPWLAQTLVVSRASIEPNYQGIYLGLLDVLKVHSLHVNVLSQTYGSIYLLLRSSKIVDSSSERGLLKNLGMWLGGLTLARNLPILHKDLSLKDLLLDAFLHDRLIAIVPFVCKVTEQSTSSRAFTPDNPWVHGILRLLAELYTFADLKLNLKFEIEVLCKNLNVDINCLEPSNIIREKASSSGLPSKGLQIPTSPSFWISSPTILSTSKDSLPPVALESFVNLAVFNRAGSNPLIGTFSPILRRVIAMSVEFAVRDISLPIAQRSWTISSNTCKSLIVKDFTNYPPSSRDKVIRSVFSSMAPGLAISLANVTSRDSLKGSVIGAIKNILQWTLHSAEGKDSISLASSLTDIFTDVLLEGLSDDNVDIAVAYLEKLTGEHVKAQLESSVSQLISIMSQVKPNSDPPSSYDSAIRIYEEFNKHSKNSSSSINIHALPPIGTNPPNQDEIEKFSKEIVSLLFSTSGVVAAGGGEKIPHSNSPLVAATGLSLLSPGEPSTANTSAADGNSYSNSSKEAEQFFEKVCVKFNGLIGHIDELISKEKSSITLVSSLPQGHEIRSLMKQIILIASSSPIHRDDFCLLMSQRLMQGLYKTTNPLFIDMAILLLIKIFEFSSKSAKEVTSWVVQSPDPRKYNVDSTTALFASGLIYVLDFDAQLSRQLDATSKTDPSSPIVDFATKLIRKCIFSESPAIAAPYDFVYSLESLGKILSSLPSAKERDDTAIAKLLSDISTLVKAPQPESQLLRDQITFCFTDWFRLCQYPNCGVKLTSSFVNQLYGRGFMDSENSCNVFFQTCTELAVELWVRQRRSPAPLAYRSIDALARLVGQILRFHPLHQKKNTAVEPMKIISIVHSVSGMILMQGLDQGLEYLQRPFTRLFTSLSSEIFKQSIPEPVTADVPFGNVVILDSMEVLENLVSFYQLLSPKNYPSFSFGCWELFMNRTILPRLLGIVSDASYNQARCWEMLSSLLTSYLAWAKPYLVDPDKRGLSSKSLFGGIVRSLLIVRNDCPSFLLSFRHTLLDKLSLPSQPSSSASLHQLRNIILSAVPTNSPLPDPLLVDAMSQSIFNDGGSNLSLVEAVHSRIQEIGQILPGNCRFLADNLAVVSNVNTLISQCRRSSTSSYDLNLISRVLLYLGLNSLSIQLTTATGSNTPFQISSSKGILEFIKAFVRESKSADLMATLYSLTNGIVDQLTYPGLITAYFHSLLLHLFENGIDGSSVLAIREVIARILVERLIVHRPHPWGVMVTLVELVRHERYKFWEQPFTKSSPEIELVFESINKNCCIPPPPPSMMRHNHHHQHQHSMPITASSLLQ